MWVGQGAYGRDRAQLESTASLKSDFLLFTDWSEETRHPVIIQRTDINNVNPISVRSTIALYRDLISSGSKTLFISCMNHQTIQYLSFALKVEK